MKAPPGIKGEGKQKFHPHPENTSSRKTLIGQHGALPKPCTPSTSFLTFPITLTPANKNSSRKTQGTVSTLPKIPEAVEMLKGQSCLRGETCAPWISLKKPWLTLYSTLRGVLRFSGTEPIACICNYKRELIGLVHRSEAE